MEPLYKSLDSLALLGDTDFEYELVDGKWSDIFGSDDGMGDKPHRYYRIKLSGVKLGTISRCEDDGSWSATFVNSDHIRGYTTHGFAHEYYAAKYLEEIAERLHRLDHLPGRFYVV